MKRLKKQLKKNHNTIAINNKIEDKDIIIYVDENQSWFQKNYISLQDRDEDKNTWTKSKDWKDQKDEDEIQWFLYNVENHEDINDQYAFETLYKASG